MVNLSFVRRVGPHSNIEKRLTRKIPIKQQKSIPRLLYSHLLKNKFASHFVLEKQQKKKKKKVSRTGGNCYDRRSLNQKM